MQVAARGLLATVLIAGACSSGDAELVERVALADTPAPSTSAAPTTTTSITTTTTPTVDDREAEILAVIDLYWHTGVEANDPPDPDHELLPLVAAGGLLDHLRAVAERKIADREGNRYRDGTAKVVQRAEVMGIDGDIALVEVCVVDNTLLYDLDSGAILDDDIRIVHAQHTVEQTASGWRVVEARRVQRLGEAEQCESAF